MRSRGHRLVGWGWVGVTALMLMATGFAAEMEGRFADGAVRLRPFMQSYNLALGGLHLLALALLTAGALRLASSRAQKTAVAALALSVAAVVIFLAAPLWWGAGPWAPDAWPVKASRVLVFAPSALRAVGCAALALALFRSHTASYVIVALLAADLSLVVWRWTATPKAVIACLHPFCAAPLGLGPWLLASALFLGLLSRSATPT